MRRLLDGVRRYELKTKPKLKERFESLADGQNPLTLFITCADSRVVPNLIAAADPGELFTVRNVANLVPPSSVEAEPSVPACISYAVEVLDVTDIVVCGHSNCGGMRAMLADPPENKHLRRWLDYAQPSVDMWRVHGALDPSLPEHDQLSQINALRQLEHVASYDCVRDRMKKKQLKLHAWWFDIAAGKALAYSTPARRYVPAVEELARLEAEEQKTSSADPASAPAAASASATASA